MFVGPAVGQPEQVRKGAGTVVPSAQEGEQRSPQPGQTALGAARLIARDDLVACLDRAVARKVTVVCAPAGSGKTSLLRAWTGRPGQVRRVAFVQVRRDEQDAQAFWLALLNAICSLPGTASRTPAPTATPDFQVAMLADRVLSELARQRDGVIMVIDDLHELNSPLSVVQLARVLANLPGEARAIVATRRDLRLGLHRLRLTGELAEIRGTDLRFTEREARELFAAAGVALSGAGAQLLYQRTEGWAAGLRLAALSLAGHPDPEQFIADFSGSDRTVAEYLIAEMLERQPGDVQNLLLRTALPDQVNGDLADLLTGRPGSERILLSLEDANAFVVSLNSERTWFRYHHLFGDLLRLELRRRLPEEVTALHRQAAGWFIRHGRAADAIRHTQSAGDWSDAARMLADHSFSLTMDGQGQTVRTLLRAFPRDGAGYLELAIVRGARSLAWGRLDEAAADLMVAEAYAETTPPDRRRRLRIANASLKLRLATHRGRLTDVTEQAALLASPLSGQSEEDITLGNDLRAMALMNLGTVEAARGLADAERRLLEGADLARKIGRPYIEVRCLVQLGLASRIRSLAATRRRCEEAIALAESHGWGAAWMTAPAQITLAATMVWAGEFDEAERRLLPAAQAVQADGGPDTRLLLHQTTGMLMAGRGRNREALEEFSAAERLHSQLEGPHATAAQVTGWMLATQARLGMASGARAALAALRDEQASAGELGNARAAICLAEGDPAGALAALRAVLDGIAPVIGNTTLVEARLLAALACRELGDLRAANQAAERALALAEADRLVLPFAMTDARELLEALPSHETAHAALVAEILDVLRGSPVTPREDCAQLAERLSPGELRVLRYLPTTLTRHEIAGELSVSVNTVSTHLRRIYVKLQVGDRSAAVRRARELRLIAPGRRPAPA
jgi:LuxR family transcriptional regulator, maltose regulon positive regulatory protein